ncbi:hypothetical protein B0H13DRAFT_1934884 [Mycena leptocephala]|nr:hypothetical protein B0H13DRAFT_1934884 [Mycena leptocephala]
MAPAAAPAATPAPMSAFTSPMAVYALGTWAYDEGASRTCSSDAGDNVLPRFGRGESVAPVLNEDVIRTVPDVVVEPLSIYATDAIHAASPCSTFLDSAASEPCVVNQARFITYQKIDICGSTAVKSGGGFQVEGRGTAEFTVRVADGSIHKIHVEGALHTPGFAMNLISLPTLDTRGFRGEWGNGQMSVHS